MVLAQKQEQSRKSLYIVLIAKILLHSAVDLSHIHYIRVLDCKLSPCRCQLFAVATPRRIELNKPVFGVAVEHCSVEIRCSQRNDLCHSGAYKN